MLRSPVWEQARRAAAFLRDGRPERRCYWPGLRCVPVRGACLSARVTGAGPLRLAAGSGSPAPLGVVIGLAVATDLVREFEQEIWIIVGSDGLQRVRASGLA